VDHLHQSLVGQPVVEDVPNTSPNLLFKTLVPLIVLVREVFLTLLLLVIHKVVSTYTTRTDVALDVGIK
jgi:hypothetical protein